MKSISILATAILLCASAGVYAQEAARFPFVLPWNDASSSITDVGRLNPVPAGVNGFIAPREGHFYDEKGNRVRFLGVNMAADTAFPVKADAEKVAARLHKFGFNIVRLHHLDADWSKPNLFDPAFQDTQHFNKEALDRLDYFIFQLKQHGVYVNLNLKVSRSFTPADGLPEPGNLPYAGKPADYFMPRMIELQKEFARNLLTHLNPYTQSKYAEEPAVAVVEINNENSLLGEAWGSTLDNLPAPYKAELQRQWNAWLKAKYVDTDGLKRAWSLTDKPFGPNRLLNSDFSQGAEHWTLELNTAPAAAKMELPELEKDPPGGAKQALRIHVTKLGAQNWHIQLHQTAIDLTEGEPYTVSFWARADRLRALPVYASLDKADWHQVGLNAEAKLTKEWQKFTFAFTANRTEKGHNRLSFVLGGELGTLDLTDITLRPGVETAFPEGISLEKGAVLLGHPVSNPAGQDWITFLIETEDRYMTGMRDLIKKEIKAKANVTGSQASYGGLGGLLRESSSDFVDMHAYWQHPEFPHKSWDPVDWRISNTSMTRSVTGGVLPEMARYRLANKPFTVSEYSHPAPNEFQAEGIPMLAAFAALQDWDGFYLFDYGNDRGEGKISGFFAIDANPAKMAFLPAAALLFLRNDMALANEELRLRVSKEDVPSLLAKSGQDIRAEWEIAGIRGVDALTKRLSVSFAGGAKPERASQPGERRTEEFTNKSQANGPLRWKPEAEKPVFTADSPTSKVMVGFLGGQDISMTGWRVQREEGGNNFAALMLTALDSKPIDHSFSLLLTAVGRVENTGMQWNKDHTSVGNHWGTGPTLAEGVSAAITIRTYVTSATVYALDGTGKRLNTVTSKLRGGELSFAIGPSQKTLWYEIEAGIKR